MWVVLVWPLLYPNTFLPDNTTLSIARIVGNQDRKINLRHFGIMPSQNCCLKSRFEVANTPPPIIFFHVSPCADNFVVT